MPAATKRGSDSGARSRSKKVERIDDGWPRFFVHPGASAHYVHAEAYDQRYSGRIEDAEFYAQLIEPGRTVLEYGAGTGRLTTALLEAGASVLGVDLAAPMLETLTQRCHEWVEKGRLRAVVADMREFTTKERFDVVVCGFHTFCHLYSLTDVRAFLARVFDHLRPGGLFAFDVPMPRVDAEGYDPLAQICVTEIDGPAGPELLTQRWYQPEEVRMHLAYAGFVETRVFGDFEARAPDEDTEFLQFLARKPKIVPPRGRLC